MRGKDRGKAKADRRERGSMGAMSEMINFGMGRPADDDMNFHDLDGEGFTARASGRCNPRSDLHAQCAGVC